MSIQENVNQLNKELTNFGHGLNRAFFQKKSKKTDIKTIGISLPSKNFEMPTLDLEWPALTEYHLTQSNIKPVDASTIKLNHQIETLEEEVRFEKTNVLYAQQANQKLSNQISDWEVKFRNLEFANSNPQAQVNKIPGLKRTIQFLMSEHLDIRLEDE